MNKINKEEILKAIEIFDKIDQEIKSKYNRDDVALIVNTEKQEKLVKEKFPWLRVINANGYFESDDICRIIPWKEVEPIKFTWED